MAGCQANRFAVMKVALMSNNDLLAEELKLANEIQSIKAQQAKMPSKIFMGKLKLSDDRHQKVIEEIERRLQTG